MATRDGPRDRTAHREPVVPRFVRRWAAEGRRRRLRWRGREFRPPAPSHGHPWGPDGRREHGRRASRFDKGGPQAPHRRGRDTGHGGWRTARGWGAGRRDGGARSPEPEWSRWSDIHHG